jgi:hypothetical protein
MAKKIKTKLETFSNAPKGFHLSGWLSGKMSYLWFGTKDTAYANLTGYSKTI